MKMLSYNVYLLINKNEGINFGIIGLQNDNTFNIRIEAFMNTEEVEMTEAKFKAKSWTVLEIGALGDFNGCHITIKAEFIIVV